MNASTSATCPECGDPLPADAPGGICPACALRAGLGFGERGEQSTLRAPGRGRGVPYTVEELSERLPELTDFRLIGQGGMGAVYRARQKQLNREVAVKVLDPELGQSSAFAERFTREAQTLARLTHPNIVAVFDYGQRGDLFFLVMELVDGVTLRQTIEAGGVAPAEALAMVQEICLALQFAHEQGVVHRDIKPENILVDSNGKIRIADFGLAKLVGSETEPRLTVTRQVMGTPHYMAPEQIEHPLDVDHRADIFALGVVFYELLTGELPVGRFPPPSRKVEVDVRLDKVVLRTLEKEPGLRYQHVSELQTEVEYLAAPGSPGRPGGWGEAAQWLGLGGSQARDPWSGDSWEGGTYAGNWGVPGDGGSYAGSWSGRRAGFEYTSKARVGGIPLIHICFPRDWRTNRFVGAARGVVAIGDVAIGAIAMGGVAMGGLALGGLSLGLLSWGGLALGLFTFAGVAVGLFSIGGASVGVFSEGGRSWSVVPTEAFPFEMLMTTVGAASLVLALLASFGSALWITGLIGNGPPLAEPPDPRRSRPQQGAPPGADAGRPRADDP